MLTIIFSFLILVIILFLEVLLYRKSFFKECDSVFYKKLKKLTLVQLCALGLVILLFVVLFLIKKESYKYFFNLLLIIVFLCPMYYPTIYFLSCSEIPLMSEVGIIVVRSISKKYLNLFNKAGIYVWCLNEKEINGFKMVNLEQDLEKNRKKNCMIAKELDLSVKKMIENDSTIAIGEEKELYEKIRLARGKKDNVIRCIKFLFIITFSVFGTEMLLLLGDFPLLANVSLILFMKLFLYLYLYFVFLKMPFDTDLMSRSPVSLSCWFGKQDIILTFLQLLFCIMGFSLPAMFLYANDLTQPAVTTIFLIEYFYLLLFMTYSFYSEKNILYNLFKGLRFIPLLLSSVFIIFLTISFLFIKSSITMNVGIQNYFGSIIFAVLSVVPLELVKFARYTTCRGGKKSASKNHKKARRS